MNNKKKVALIGTLSIVLLLFFLFEIVAYCAYIFVIYPRAGFLVYAPPELIPKSDYESYLAERDPVLGWPKYKNRHEPRPSPASRETIQACISTYGDSFTYGDEVEHEDAWANVIAAHLRCRVDNFGVSGYGTDQAYLRFQLNTADYAPITILGIYPQNALRNISQHRFFITGAGQLEMKPRFILRDGALEHVALATVPYEDLPKLYETPAEFFHHEEFLPGSDYGPITFSFPYTLSTIRFLLKDQIMNWISGKPSWADYWQPGHSTKAMEIMVGITTRFHQECQKRQKNCLVIIYPTPTSFNWFLAEKKLISQAFINAISTQGINVLDLTEGLAKKINYARLCRLLSDPENCRGHLNPRGNQFVAEIVIEHLRSLHWLETEQKEESITER